MTKFLKVLSLIAAILSCALFLMVTVVFLANLFRLAIGQVGLAEVGKGFLYFTGGFYLVFLTVLVNAALTERCERKMREEAEKRKQEKVIKFKSA